MSIILLEALQGFTQISVDVMRVIANTGARLRTKVVAFNASTCETRSSPIALALMQVFILANRPSQGLIILDAVSVAIKLALSLILLIVHVSAKVLLGSCLLGNLRWSF